MHRETEFFRRGVFIVRNYREKRSFSMSKGRILVVEDNMDNYELVRFILERAGYDVFLAMNGRDGVSAARLQKPDLILMDLGLPEMDGWRAAERLKAEEATRVIPLYALSAHTLPAERKRALEAGCDGYVSKPIHMAGFLDMIESALGGKRGKKTIGTSREII
jgi:CheY-like chemotaxis protein